MDELKEALEEQEKEEKRLQEDNLMLENKIGDGEVKSQEDTENEVVYIDKPISPRPWNPESTSNETEEEISNLNPLPIRETISIEVTRPKKMTKQPYAFYDKNSDISGVVEFRAYKDPNFKHIKESDLGIQIAPQVTSSSAQTTWFRSVNKAIQYEPIKADFKEEDELSSDNFLAFLEKATLKIETSLQQNESVDIFLETSKILGEDEVNDGLQADNELKELKNFADPNYSKFKALAAIDWMPKAQGLVAVSAVRNISFDQRIPLLGQTHTSYVLLWDFRLLVKPLIIMQCHHEVFTFRFNKIQPGLVAGGCITGQVVLWDINDALAKATNSSSRGSARGAKGGALGSINDDNDESSTNSLLPIAPKYVSHLDMSHKKCVADLFWLPPTTQINYRGQLVSDEHLDGNSYQFITISGDGMIMVWDIRYEKIFNDELRHIARPKHVPSEKIGNKESGGLRPLWAPIFKAHLKRLEGVGELSLCKISFSSSPGSSNHSLKKPSSFPGDSRSQFIISTEEGDLILADLSAKRTESNKEDEDEDDSEFSCVKWINFDHPRPTVYMQESPFFPQVVLTVSDWSFNIWKLGEKAPLFAAPMSSTYLTSGAWSPTRPAVLFIACADGQVLVWDFTDTSFHPSIELKATHSKITSMEFLNSSMATRQQLLAVGDEVGTLHIFEVPRNLSRPVHKEEFIMLSFLERELEREENAVSIAEQNQEEEEEDPFSRLNIDADNTNENAEIELTLEEKENAEFDKEEEEFLKLESVFISELGLDTSQLPDFMQRPVDEANTNKE